MARKIRHTPVAKPTTLSRGKRRLFRGLVVGFPFLLLAGVELTLRLFNLGGYAPMLRRVGPVEGGTLVVADQGGAASWFFATPTRAGGSEQYAFLDPKPAGTVRIFLVGASAIEGYPQPRHLASSAFLQAMLQDAWPERKVEVINLGATAIASFPVCGILTEALEYEPDLVVIHTGHNEFFGAYGVASVSRAGNRPWMLQATRWIQSLALMQGLNQLLHPDREHLNRSLMETMMGRQHIGAHDKRREAAARNLHHNVSEMLRRCQAAGVPALVCTQPTNERDLAPVGTDNLDGLSPAAQHNVKELLAEENATLDTDPAAAEAAARQVIQQAPDHARAHYLLGRALAAQGKAAPALDAFIKARDLDPLPWRIPTSSQDAVLRAAAEHSAPVCDLTARFRAESPQGIIGWELMDDHVHPTLTGQVLTAESILDSLTRFEGALNVSPEARSRVASPAEYRQRLGDNLYDRYATAHAMRIIFDAPFMRENNPGAFERFNMMATEIESQLTQEVRGALLEWQETQPYAGSRCPVTAAVAQLLVKQGRYDEALKLYEIALRAVPEYTSWNLEYTYYSLYCAQKLQGSLTDEDRDRAHEAIRQGEFLCRWVPSAYGFSERYTGFLHLLCREFGGAIPYLEAYQDKPTGLDRLAVDQALILCYLQTGNFEKALGLARAGAGRPGEYAAQYQSLLDSLPGMIEAVRAAPSSNPPATD